MVRPADGVRGIVVEVQVVTRCDVVEQLSLRVFHAKELVTLERVLGLLVVHNKHVPEGEVEPRPFLLGLVLQNPAANLAGVVAGDEGLVRFVDDNLTNSTSFELVPIDPAHRTGVFGRFRHNLLTRLADLLDLQVATLALRRAKKVRSEVN